MTITDDPRVERSRARILEAARASFLAHGYAGATVDDIARHAGVVRRTVFNVFADKESLFRATALGSIATAEEFLDDLTTRMDDVVDPVAELPDLAVRLAATVLREPVVALRRLLAAEAARFPDLVAEYWRRAPGAVIEALAAVLARLDAAGRLRIADPRQAASHFAYLVLGEELDRGMLGVPAPRTSAVDVAGAAHVFLRAYAP